MVNVEFIDWSKGWVLEGQYVSYIIDRTRYYEYVVRRDLAHWEYDWPEPIAPYTASGPTVPDDLVVTKEYDSRNNRNRLWQVLFGIKGEVFVYIELPSDVHRHGIPKVPKPSSDFRRTSHFEDWMTQFMEPTFMSEHWMKKPEVDRVAISIYNPNTIIEWDTKLNFFINKIETERIGTVTGGSQSPTEPRFRETLDKLYRHVMPCRPISLMPVRAPAAE